MQLQKLKAHITLFSTHLVVLTAACCSMFGYLAVKVDILVAEKEKKGCN